MKKRTCRKRNCREPHYGKGHCRAHYLQLPETKKRQKKYAATYYQNNTDSVKSRSVKYYIDNKEQVKKTLAAWYQKNKVKLAKKYQKNKKKLSKQARDRYHAKKERG